MFPDDFTDEDAKELTNAIYDFMHYRASRNRAIIMCVVILVILVLLAIWLL